MKNIFVENITAGSFSLILHIALIALFVIGMDSQSVPISIAQPEQVEIVQATMMDENNILEEMVRQQEIVDKKRNDEQARQDLVQQRLEDTQKELARKELEYQD
ncbi:MAG: protein TolA, partial [Pseudomonadota bacterium]|nr:protein TolA [Pseudomonadota bacterium]